MVYFLSFVFTVFQCFSYHFSPSPCLIQDDKKEELARPKPSSKYDKGEEKQEKVAEKLEKEPEKPEAKKETKDSKTKHLKEATFNEPKSGTDSHFSCMKLLQKFCWIPCEYFFGWDSAKARQLQPKERRQRGTTVMKGLPCH